MARVKNNISLSGIAGRVGDYVYRTRNGKTYISKRPKPSGSSTAGQLAARKLFKEASQFAQTALHDPLLSEFYSSRVKGNQSFRNIAIADYFIAPEFHNTNVDGYKGNVGDKISAMITDNGKVVSVHVTIFNSNGLVEEGDAITTDDLHWKYFTTVFNEDLPGTVIRIIAKDMAGRTSIYQSNNQDVMIYSVACNSCNAESLVFRM